jgi:cytidylate kinase
VVRLIRGIAWHGRVIIIGRASGIICSDMIGGVNIGMVAPFAWRMDNIKHLKSGESAYSEKALHDKDKQRERFYKKYFNVDIGAYRHFDIVFNNARLSAGEMAEMIRLHTGTVMRKIKATSVA